MMRYYLVREAYPRLEGDPRGQPWNHRPLSRSKGVSRPAHRFCIGHVLCAMQSCTLMHRSERSTCVERYRSSPLQSAQKRGAGLQMRLPRAWSRMIVFMVHAGVCSVGEGSSYSVLPTARPSAGQWPALPLTTDMGE